MSSMSLPNDDEPLVNWASVSLGMLTPFMVDDSVTDVLINGHREVYVERKGKLEKTPVTFPDDVSVLELAHRIVEAVGRTLDPSRPLVDARLADGSRVNVIAPPLAV